MFTIETKYGEIVLTEEFLTDLAGNAAINCFGVVGMANKSPVDAVFSLICQDRLSRGIKVRTDGMFVDIDLHIVVSYGTNITTIVNSIAHRIRYIFDSMCGLTVRDINTFVDGMKA